MSKTMRQMFVADAITRARAKRRTKANAPVQAWYRYAERDLCGKSAPMRDSTWLVCVRPKGHGDGCETGDDLPCVFDSED